MGALVNSLSFEKSIFRFLPEPIVLEVFKFASPIILARISCVCKKWKELASTQALWDAFDLEELFPTLEILCETIWEKVNLKDLGLSFNAPSLDKRVFIPAIITAYRNDKAPTLLYMPKGLTRNILAKLTTGFETFFIELGDIPVEKSYRVLLAQRPSNANTVKPPKSLQQIVKENDPEIFEALQLMTIQVLRRIHSQKKSNFEVSQKPLVSKPRTHHVSQLENVTKKFSRLFKDK